MTTTAGARSLGGMQPVDPDKRRALLARLRTEQTREQARLTPTQRLLQSFELLKVCGSSPTTDEPPEIWLRLQADLRRNG